MKVWNVRRRAGPGGLSLGGDRKDLKATAAVDCSLLDYRVAVEVIQQDSVSPSFFRTC